MAGNDVSPFEELSLNQLRQRRSVKWRMFEPDVLPVFVAEMDTPLAPPIAAALAEAVAAGDTGYAWGGGLPAAFSGFAARRYGWTVPPQAPILVADVMAGVRVALELLSRPGDKVVVSTPAYPPFFSNIHRCRRQLVVSPLRNTEQGYRLDLDRLERDFADGAAVFLLCNPHNPVGRAFTRPDLTAIAALADRYGVAVISDEIHAPLTMPGHDHIPFATIDADCAAKGFTAVAASKAWNLAGLKSALLVPGEDADICDLPDEPLWAEAGLLGVVAGEAAFDEGEAWLTRIIEGIDLRRKLLSQLLMKQLPQARYVPPEATYLAWLDLREYQLGEDPAAVLLEGGRVAVNGGDTFGEAGAGFIRLNLATSVDNLTEAVRRIASAVR